MAARLELNSDVGAFLCKLLELAGRSKGSFTRADQRYHSNTLDFVRARAVESPAAATLVPALRTLQQQ